MNAMFSILTQTVANWISIIFRRRSHKIVEPLSLDEPVTDEPTELGRLEPRDKVDELERARRRHDKFVRPNGELPVRPKRDPRPTREIKPEAAAAVAKPDDTPFIEEQSLGFVAEPHHESREDGDVLFKVEEALGEFNFRDTILDQLDRYFFYLKRMKKHDSDAYGLYKRIGATILPYLATGAFHHTKSDPDPSYKTAPIPPLPPWFRETRPTFGCYAYGTDAETEKFEQEPDPENPKLEMWVPKFMYFHKNKIASSDIQPMKGGDIYTLTMWWDRPSGRMKHGIPQQVPIFVSEDGKTIIALKVRRTAMTPMRSSRDGHFSIPSRRWEIPKEYRDWAKQHEEDIQHFLTSLFVNTINHSVNSHMSMVRIEVAKHGMMAVFSVNIRRTAYFFQDRDIEVTDRGTRKPVFHLVRPHIRKDGSAVKMHFRGAREFTWAGYQVRITVPGFDHIDFTDLDAGLVDSSEVKSRKGYMTFPELGKEMADEIHKVRRTGTR
jgi:hypothetical protein